MPYDKPTSNEPKRGRQPRSRVLYKRTNTPQPTGISPGAAALIRQRRSETPRPLSQV